MVSLTPLSVLRLKERVLRELLVVKTTDKGNGLGLKMNVFLADVSPVDMESAKTYPLLVFREVKRYIPS